MWERDGRRLRSDDSLASTRMIEAALEKDGGAEIRAALPGLRFSAMRLELKLRVAGVFPESLFVDRVAVKNGVLHEVDADTDNAILGATWHPLDSTRVDALRVADGRLTAGQFVNLLSNSLAAGSVLNQSVSSEVDWFATVKAMAPPQGLRAELYPYQAIGSAAMRMLAGFGLGTLLADEMGLGKTLQVITVLLSKPVEEPTLVVVPAALVENWRRELHDFAPSLSVLVHEGPRRTGVYSGLAGHDVVICSYETLVIDYMLFSSVDWGILVADEAQLIRNPDAARSQTIKLLRRRISIAVTGTPIENRPQDLWSISEFVLPGLLGARDVFNQFFEGEADSAEYLGRLMSCVTVRRSVEQVGHDLPDRLDTYTSLALDEFSRAELASAVQSSVGLEIIVREQVVCAHAAAEGPAGSEFVARPKVSHLLGLLEEAFARGEKVLIFCEYIASIDRLMDVIPVASPKVIVQSLTGAIPAHRRQRVIDDFSASGSAGCLVMQIDAAGTGLNITAANHVVFFNPDWNPAKTSQAAARAHRRGQRRTVLVHHLYYAGTIEERQLASALGKADVADEVRRGMSLGMREGL